MAPRPCGHLSLYWFQQLVCVLISSPVILESWCSVIVTKPIVWLTRSIMKHFWKKQNKTKNIHFESRIVEMCFFFHHREKKHLHMCFWTMKLFSLALSYRGKRFALVVQECWQKLNICSFGPMEFIYMHKLILKNRSTEKKSSRKTLSKLKKGSFILPTWYRNITFYKRFLFIGLGWPEQPNKTLFTNDYIKNNK